MGRKSKEKKGGKKLLGKKKIKSLLGRGGGREEGVSGRSPLSWGST